MDSTDTKILDKLLEQGALDREQYQRVHYFYNSHGGAIEDAIIDSGVMEEEPLLKQLAQIYRTRFVATDKLKKAEISRTVIEKVPRKVAEQYTICPILFDANSNEISIITADPSDLAAEQAVAKASGIPRVRSFVARPGAVRAAIAKFYKGDIHAFAPLDRAGFEAYHSMLDVYERNLLDAETMTTSLAEEGSKREQLFSEKDIKVNAIREQQTGSTIGTDISSVLEILKVTVSLLESNRSDLAGHSIQVASLIRQVCGRINLSKRDTSAFEMAGLLHDLGKGSPYHLTALNVAEWEGHKTSATKRFGNPEQLFSSVALPENTVKALHHMYERFDGQGIPDQLHGKDIPLSARILALADTYSDLTSNPRNPFRRILSTEQAMKVLGNAKEKVFDPNLVDLFAIVVAGDDLKRQLLTGAQTVLIVDADPEQSAILDLQLTSRGFRVRKAQSAAMALKVVQTEKPAIIVSEVNLGNEDGFALKNKLNKEASTREIPFIFFTTRAADVEKGFALGAQDYLVKPSSVDIVSAKIHKLLEDKVVKAGGVSGSLTEMSLPDLVQILSHSRKNGRLKLKMGQYSGEIHFMNGEIFNAFFGTLRGEEAFFQMLRHREGTFSLNPHFKADTKVIQMNSEMLLLEGMRRIDEESR
jgi:response regulator RpfG family c-di-GMP phosphodiesterase